MALETSKIVLPREVVPTVINKVKGTSTIAALSPSEPQIFANREYQIFMPSAEAEVVAEGGKKHSYEQDMKPVTGRNVKVVTTTRVSNELKFADEDNQLEIVSNIINDQAEALGRALDSVVYFGINPRDKSALDGYDHLVSFETTGGTAGSTTYPTIAEIKAWLQQNVALTSSGSASNDSDWQELADYMLGNSGTQPTWVNSADINIVDVKKLDFQTWYAANTTTTPGTPATGSNIKIASDISAAIDSMADKLVDYNINGFAMSRKLAGDLRKVRVPMTGQRLYPEIPLSLEAGMFDGIPATTSKTVGHNDCAGIMGDFNCIKWGLVRDITSEVIEYGDPDNSGVDLKGANQIAYRTEAVFNYAILDKDAFAVATY